MKIKALEFYKVSERLPEEACECLLMGRRIVMVTLDELERRLSEATGPDRSLKDQVTARVAELIAQGVTVKLVNGLTGEFRPEDFRRDPFRIVGGDD